MNFGIEKGENPEIIDTIVNRDKNDTIQTFKNIINLHLETLKLKPRQLP